MKRITKYAVALCVIALASVLACGDPAPSGPATPPPAKIYRVGIATLMSHPALDAVIENLKKELAARGFTEGTNVEYILRNANGDANMSAQIARDLENQRTDLVIAVTTPMAQAVRKVTTRPMIFSAVTDPVGAGIVPAWDQPILNVTGVSDAWPYRQQLELTRRLFPAARKLAVLYNPGEAASQYGIARIREVAPELGYELKEITVARSGEVLMAARGVAAWADVLYLSSDNTVIEGVPGAAKAAFEARKPLIVGDAGTIKRGGLATVSVGYEGVGRETGRLAAEMLNGNTTLPIVVAHGDEVYLNTAVARKIGFTFPQEILDSAKQVIDTIE